MRKRILLTGATGAVGTALLPELLARGHAVTCLIRPNAHERPEQRLGRLFAHSDVACVAGDIAKPACGVSADLRGAFDAVVHAAADTRLEQRDAAARHAANLDGTVNTLAWAKSIGAQEFHYVGTAYIAGTAGMLAEQDIGEQLTVGAPRNPYEASKLAAEQRVRAWPGKLSIYRPSIVVGRADDGRTQGLHGIYAFFKAVWRMHANLCSGDYRDGFGRVVTRTSPIHISPGVELERSLNLVPLDWLASTMATLIGRPASGRCYNLVNDCDIPLSELLQSAFQAMDIDNVVIDERPGMVLSPVVAAVNRAVRSELERFRPYLSGSVAFEARHAYADLPSEWPRPPTVDGEFIRRTLAAALLEWQRETGTDEMRRTAS